MRLEERGQKKRIKNWIKNSLAGHWQKWMLTKIKCTHILRTWSLGDKLYVEKIICPWGIHNFLGNLMRVVIRTLDENYKIMNILRTLFKIPRGSMSFKEAVYTIIC